MKYFFLIYERANNIQRTRKSNQTSKVKMSAIKNISLYIPRVFANYIAVDVANVFESLNIGKVKAVDLVYKMGIDGKPYNAAYIHFYYWYDNAVAVNFQERVLNPNQEARLVYDDPWYWVVLENNAKKFLPGARKQTLDISQPQTPVINYKKTADLKELLRAPKKVRQVSFENNEMVPRHLDEEFAIEEEADEDAANMDECEEAMLAEDNCLVTIDARYVQALEEENKALREQAYQFQCAYYQETVKSQALAEAFQKLHKD